MILLCSNIVGLILIIIIAAIMRIIVIDELVAELGLLELLQLLLLPFNGLHEDVVAEVRLMML